MRGRRPSSPRPTGPGPGLPADSTLRRFEADARGGGDDGRGPRRGRGQRHREAHHLLLGIASSGGRAAWALATVGLDPPAIRRAIGADLGPPRPTTPVRRRTGRSPGGERARFTPMARTALVDAARRAEGRGEGGVAARHLALGVLDARSMVVARTLTDAGVTVERLRAALG